MKKVVKAGCYLIDVENKKVALVYREKQKDYTFPKGHLEGSESIKECAIRETAEETKRVAKILDEFEPTVERYTSSNGENCECYMFIAKDFGASDNSSTDTHDVHWIDFEEVENKLTYDSLKNIWKLVKNKIENLFN